MRSPSSPLSTVIRPLSGVNNLKKNKSILIAGFPGPGLVGSISTSYIINKLKMHQIACVESQYISPGVIFIDGKLRHPFRLYANDEGNVCVLVCEAPLMINGIHSVLDTVMEWAIKNTIQEVLVLDGIPVQGIPRSDRKSILLESNEMDENIRNDEDAPAPNNLEPISSNFKSSDNENSYSNHTTFIGGIAGGLLSACLSNQIPCAAILVHSSSGIPDPEGAAILIDSYNKIIKDEKLKINSNELKEQGQVLKSQLEQIIKSEQEQREQGPMTGQGIMYG
ncbi:MAG: proteasome assembly chaperone family protein [Nitrosopumilus sp.]|nr:proteasome assembly chaperone family protein [Nitrosopumilus sp.]